MNTRSRVLVAIAVAVCAGGSAAPGARADGNGTYTNWLCFDRDTGKGVGASPQLSSSAAGVPLTLSQDCGGSASGGNGITMVTGLPTHTSDGNRGGITWTAPAGVTAAGLEYWRSLKAPGNQSHFVITENGTGPDQIYPADLAHKGETFYWYGTNGTDGNVVDTGNPNDPFGAANGPIGGGIAPDGRTWHIAFGCDSAGGGGCDVPSGALNLRISSARMTLKDGAAPRLDQVAGALASDTPVRGTAALAFNASDAGAGVYRVIVAVDGKRVEERVLDGNGGACADVNTGNDNPYEFASAAPCKGAVGGSASLDTTKLADGARRVQVLVEDAAGNQAIALDRTLTVDNRGDGIGPGDPLEQRGAANGSPAPDTAKLTLSWSTKSAKTVRTASYGHLQRLGGTLTGADGTPIAGASIDVGKRLRRTGDVAKPAKSVVTGPDGRFEIRFPAGASYDVRASYRSRANDTVAVATATGSLRIRAAVSLAVTPRRARGGTRLRFSGRLRGGSVPAKGKQVLLQVRSGKGWSTFKVVRTTRSGRFATRYALPSSSVARYRFRALSRFEAAYPFETGSSASRVVVKR